MNIIDATYFEGLTKAHCFLVSRGVRPLALVGEVTKEIIENLLYISSISKGRFKIRAEYYESDVYMGVTENVSAVIYRDGYKEEADELAKLMTTSPRNHRRIGELLRYHPDIIWDK